MCIHRGYSFLPKLRQSCNINFGRTCFDRSVGNKQYFVRPYDACPTFGLKQHCLNLCCFLCSHRSQLITRLSCMSGDENMHPRPETSNHPVIRYVAISNRGIRVRDIKIKCVLNG